MTINEIIVNAKEFIFLIQKEVNMDKIHSFIKREFILDSIRFKMRSRIEMKKGRRNKHGNEAS